MSVTPPDHPTAPRRAVVLVIDALGAGPEADAADYGDAGADTLLHLAEALGGLDLPVLELLGLGNIAPLPGVAPSPDPVVHGTLAHQGPGKDSTTGHWELMGVVPRAPLPAFPAGLPPELLRRLGAATGLALCGGEARDGLQAIDELGAHHLRTGEVIVYTSVDSVVQLAAHTSVLDQEQLENACAAARIALCGEDAVGRVIARPFDGEPGAFRRTPGRRDFAVPPPGRTALDVLTDAGVPVHAVGKIDDLFGGRGITAAHPGSTNAQALDSVDALLGGLDRGLIFANLIETDQVYGHRKDVAGFHEALQRIDAAIGRWLGRLGAGDLLVVTADHGVDPAAAHSDHTRERVPLLARFDGHGGRRHDGVMADVGAGVISWLAPGAEGLAGTPFC